MSLNPSPNFSHPLIVFALESESAGRFDDQNVLYSGVGKISAAMALTRALTADKPSVVINLGTAGSGIHKAGAVVNVTRFVQRDMDVTPLGFLPYETPYADLGEVLENGLCLEDLSHATCGTGDNFAVDEDFGHGHYDIVDMEAYAHARICHEHGVPFLCLKYISDGADGAAHKDWHDALLDGAEKLRAVLDGLG